MTDEHWYMAQKIPEFFPIVSSSEFIVKKFPWAVHNIAAPIPTSTEAA